MSLLTESFEPFLMLDKATQSDGYGGYVTTWTEGAEFQAAATFDTSIAARVAAVQGVKNLYISPSVHVEQLAPGKGIRYTAMVKTGRMKNGNATKVMSR